MTDYGEVSDDHPNDAVAERQFNNIVDWLRDFVDPLFRRRVWQEGTGVGQFYEETAEQFFSDFSLEWLIDEGGLRRLGAPLSMIEELRRFWADFRAFDGTLPQRVDAVRLEADPKFRKIVDKAQTLLSIMEQSRTKMRQITDDI